MELVVDRYNISLFLNKYIKDANSTILDLTNGQIYLDASILCKPVPRVIKIAKSKKYIEYSNVKVWSTFNHEFIPSDVDISLIVIDTLDVLENENLMTYLDVLRIPILNTSGSQLPKKIAKMYSRPVKVDEGELYA